MACGCESVGVSLRLVESAGSIGVLGGRPGSITQWSSISCDTDAVILSSMIYNRSTSCRGCTRPARKRRYNCRTSITTGRSIRDCLPWPLSFRKIPFQARGIGIENLKGVP